jgi:hypothetical protein
MTCSSVGYQACLGYGGNRTFWKRITCDGDGVRATAQHALHGARWAGDVRISNAPPRSPRVTGRVPCEVPLRVSFSVFLLVISQIDHSWSSGSCQTLVVGGPPSKKNALG